MEYAHSSVLLELDGQRVDLSRLPRLLGDALPRLIMYLSSIWRGRASGSSEGITVVHVVNAAAAKRFGAVLEQNPYELFKKGMYGKQLPKIVVAMTYEEGKEHLIDFLAFRLIRMEQFRCNQNHECVAGKSLGQTLHLLQEKGLDREYLPRCLGGCYDYNQYDDWIRKRLCVEDIMSAAPIFPNNLKVSLPTMTAVANASSQQKQATMTTTAMIGPSTKLVATSRRAVHARRIRSEEKKETSNLENQRRWLLQKNESIRVDNRRLETALAKVRYLAAIHDSDGITP
eukprot:scaffold39706_cov260-Amphora_coffeaeformis.AAC.1